MVLQSQLSVCILHLLHRSILFDFEHLEWVVFLFSSLWVILLEKFLLLLSLRLVLFEELIKESVGVGLLLGFNLLALVVGLLEGVGGEPDPVGGPECSSEREEGIEVIEEGSEEESAIHGQTYLYNF
jgi:hypothetical protein